MDFQNSLDSFICKNIRQFPAMHFFLFKSSLNRYFLLYLFGRKKTFFLSIFFIFEHKSGIFISCQHEMRNFRIRKYLHRIVGPRKNRKHFFNTCCNENPVQSFHKTIQTRRCVHHPYLINQLFYILYHLLSNTF